MNEWKNKKQNIYHADLNVILMVENVTRIKTGVTINVSVSVKIKKKKHRECVKMIILEILPQAVVKMVNM